MCDNLNAVIFRWWLINGIFYNYGYTINCTMINIVSTVIFTLNENYVYVIVIKYFFITCLLNTINRELVIMYYMYASTLQLYMYASTLQFNTFSSFWKLTYHGIISLMSYYFKRCFGTITYQTS